MSAAQSAALWPGPLAAPDACQWLIRDFPPLESPKIHRETCGLPLKTRD